MLALYFGVDQPIRLDAFVLLLQREVLAFFYFLSVNAGKLLLGVSDRQIEIYELLTSLRNWY